jgi:hypothetical protein
LISGPLHSTHQSIYEKFFYCLKLFLLERAVFDFFGFMFGAIAADILHLLLLIVGLFGAYQYRVNYLVVVSIQVLI